MLVVPFSSDYDQRFITQLGDEKYRVDARWNERGGAWSFDLVRDSDGEVLIAGAPMQIGQDILSPYALGIGGLLPTDLGQKGTDAGPEDLGTRVIVTYLSPDELAAIKALLGPQGASIVVSGAIPPALRGAAIGGSSGGGGGGGGSTTVNVTNESNVTNITGAGLGFSDKFEGLADDSGDEVLIGQYIQLPNLNANPTVTLEVGVLAAGVGSLRVYIGGTFEGVGFVGTPSGTLATSATAVSGEDIYQISATPTNPNAPVAVENHHAV